MFSNKPLPFCTNSSKSLVAIGDTKEKHIDFLVDMYPEKGYDVPMEDEDMVNIFETDWYKKINSTTTPGEVLKIYRQNAELTQEELGRKLGKFSRQKISDLENGKRTIGKEVAKKLCQLFQVPVERFL